MGSNPVCCSERTSARDYVTPDNNWEILYNLRTPRTQAELREMGIKCSDSQLLLLEVGGLVSKTKGKWKATIPILDKEQTNSLRSLSKEIAESMYVKTKADFISLAQTISEMGFKNNVLSLVFSYLLDGKMWTKLVLFEDVDNYTAGVAVTGYYTNQEMALHAVRMVSENRI